MRWLTYNKASAQNSLPNPALDTILCTFSSNVQFMRSSTPFYWVFLWQWAEKSNTTFVSAQLHELIQFLLDTIVQSKSLYFLTDWVRSFSSSWKTHPKPHVYVHWVHPNSSRVVIHKLYKPIWTCQWNCLRWSPSVLSTIRNHLSYKLQ